MSDIKWIKQNGRELFTNDLPANIEAAEKLGWKIVEKKPKLKEKPKKNKGL
jgi:hypothetical protein